METGLRSGKWTFSRKKSNIGSVRLRVLEMLGQMRIITGLGDAWMSNAHWKGTPNRERGGTPGGRPDGGRARSGTCWKRWIMPKPMILCSLYTGQAY